MRRRSLSIRWPTAQRRRGWLRPRWLDMRGWRLKQWAAASARAVAGAAAAWNRGGIGVEADVSTQASEGAEVARLPRAHAVERRSARAEGASGEGTVATFLLMARTAGHVRRGGRASVFLRRGRDFEDVFQRGRAVAGPLLVVRCAAAPGPTLVGVAVGKRLGSAVRRNRMRRRWREVVRLGPALRPGAHVVLVARGASEAAAWEELREGWRRALSRLALLEVGGEVAPSAVREAGARFTKAQSPPPSR